MEKRFFGLMVIGLLAVGCAGSDTNEDRYDYIGWVCSGARQSDNWSCEMREIKDGQAVAKANTTASDTTSTVGQELNRVSEPARQRNLQIVVPPSQSWRSQLPGLDSEPVIPDTEALSPVDRKLKSRPARIPDPVPSVVTTDASPLPAPAPQSSIAEPVAYAMGGSAGAGLSVNAEKSVYTLQLAAFKDSAQLEAFIDRHHLGDLAVRQFQAYSQKQHWQLLVWGTFESPAEAREAWRSIAQQYPGVEPWVRSMSSLDMDSSQPAEVDG